MINQLPSRLLQYFLTNTLPLILTVTVGSGVIYCVLSVLQRYTDQQRAKEIKTASHQLISIEMHIKNMKVTYLNDLPQAYKYKVINLCSNKTTRLKNIHQLIEKRIQENRFFSFKDREVSDHLLQKIDILHQGIGAVAMAKEPDILQINTAPINAELLPYLIKKSEFLLIPFLKLVTAILSAKFFTPTQFEAVTQFAIRLLPFTIVAIVGTGLVYGTVKLILILKTYKSKNEHDPLILGNDIITHLTSFDPTYIDGRALQQPYSELMKNLCVDKINQLKNLFQQLQKKPVSPEAIVVSSKLLRDINILKQKLEAIDPSLVWETAA
jgi:hypothetical protein